MLQFAVMVEGVESLREIRDLGPRIKTAAAQAINKVARDQSEASAAGIPNGRNGDKFDMGGTAVYLASRAGDYTVGETLTIDGGIVNALLPKHFADPGAGH